MALGFDSIQAKIAARDQRATAGDLPADMSTMSLVGGGFIAGDALAAVTLGLYSLLKTVV
jgi:hypothetical protein